MAAPNRLKGPSPSITLFLCGDVMTGRGIDQILPHSVDPELHEPYVTDAGMYVTLAERANGSVGRQLTSAPLGLMSSERAPR